MKSRTVGIIQARMGSSRLPGKVMQPIANRSFFAYLIERVSTARSLDSVLVATTTEQRDAVIVAECERLGIEHFRGSEIDVLGRYVGAAQISQADIVVR